jgi:predicted DNA-binding protein
MSHFVRMPKDRPFLIRITQRQYQRLLEIAKSQHRPTGDVICKAIDEYLESSSSDTVRAKQIELYERLTKGQDITVEELRKIVELLSAIGGYLPKKEPQYD